MESVKANMSSVRIPGTHDRVYKSECMFSFDTPESPRGLFTSLTTWQSFGADFVMNDFERNKNHLYLRQRWYRVKNSDAVTASNDTNNRAVNENGHAAPTKLAIGVEGGFSVDKKPYDLEKVSSIVVMPKMDEEIPLDDPELPEIISLAVDAILNHEDYARTIEVTAAWEEEDRKPSKYADSLIQVENGKKILPDPSTWKCEESGMAENLWLNLSTGHIGSGRKNWDGTGGTGAALSHFEATGRKYPLVVKLGTITPHGADVFSYAPDENDMVLDPKLAEHLAHWGIDIQKMEKTEKSMAELQVDLNASFEFNKITESGSELAPISGPGYIGLENLGNTCYMNAILQILFSVKSIAERYVSNAEQLFSTSPNDPSQDLLAMTAKVAVGLTTDRYAHQPTMLSHQEFESLRTSKFRPSFDNLRSYEPSSIRPFMFKNIVGKGHTEFSSLRQQDAGEFFQHLMECLSRSERGGISRFSGNPSTDDFVPTPNLFKFVLEDRIYCEQSSMVRYTTRSENILFLPVPLDAASNAELVEQYEARKQKKQKVLDEYDEAEPVKPVIPFNACIESWGASEKVADFLSPATGSKGYAQKRTRIRTFPDYLVVQLGKYYQAANWTDQKLDVCVPVPEELDLDELRGNGLQESEVVLPEETVSNSPVAVAAPDTGAQIAPDMDIVSQLVAMGFSENGAKRAAVATCNANTEACMEWVLNHMEDADFNDPLPDSTRNDGASATVHVSDESVVMLTSMGFTQEQARVALKSTGGSLERAADWLSSHADDLDSAVVMASETTESRDDAQEKASSASSLPQNITDGDGKYELVGFASHIGNSLRCGHYVAHVRKEGKYVLYNDEKVAISQEPPLAYGFLYLYKRR